MASGKVRVVKQISQFLVRVDFFLPLFERLCEIARCQRAQDTRAIFYIDPSTTKQGNWA